MSTIRAVLRDDVDELKKVVDSCGLFPSEFLDEMIFDFFTNDQSQDIWFTFVENNTPHAIGYCVPEEFTNGTYNLLAIGVSSEYQRSGIATEMMRYIENLIKQKEGRLLIVETSSDEAQMRARNFYNKMGYKQMAVIEDFWNDGEDKIVFWKKL